MKPIDFKESNAVLRCPPGVENCDPLPVYRRMEGNRWMISSMWELSEADVNAILKARSEGKHAAIIFTSFGDTHPVISLGLGTYEAT
jgi:hypothetical protein